MGDEGEVTGGGAWCRLRADLGEVDVGALLAAMLQRFIHHVVTWALPTPWLQDEDLLSQDIVKWGMGVEEGHESDRRGGAELAFSYVHYVKTMKEKYNGGQLRLEDLPKRSPRQSRVHVSRRWRWGRTGGAAK